MLLSKKKEQVVFSSEIKYIKCQIWYQVALWIVFYNTPNLWNLYLAVIHRGWLWFFSLRTSWPNVNKSGQQRLHRVHRNLS